MSVDYPRLLVIAHDHNCLITAYGQCNCDCEMHVLVGDTPLPLPGPRIAKIHYGPRAAKLAQYFQK